MTITVQAPDGTTVQFPDDATADTIHGVMTQHFGDPGSSQGPRSTMTGAAAAGALDTGTSGFYDELRGYHEASDLPAWVDRVPGVGGWAKTLGGAYNVLTERPGLSSLVTGDPRGPYERRYEAGRDIAREALQTASDEHPGAYLTGQLAGGVGATALMPEGRLAADAGVGARALRAAGQGAIAGGLYGVGSGTDAESRLAGGAVGTAAGTVLGGALSPATDAAAWGARRAAASLGGYAQAVRAGVEPGFVDREATRRILQARATDAATPQGLPLSPGDAALAERLGIPIGNVDRGGARTMSLARSAVNQSPEARAALSDLAQTRYAEQNERANAVINGMYGGGIDHVADLDAIRSAARAANQPAYRAAYDAGDRPIWSPELERLVGAPEVRDAMRSAVTTSQNRAVAEGYGGFNPGVQVTDDGRLMWQRGANGAPTYPNLQYWDSVQRDLRDAVESARNSGNPSRAGYLGQLHDALTGELDRQVPEFNTARVGAARAFGAQDALEAGRNFVTARGENSQYAQDLGRMSDPERELFGRGFASELANRLMEIPDNKNVVNSAFLSNPAARQRIEMALGPDRARQLETYVRLEKVADRLRGELGNSTTARQLHEMGLAGHAGLAGAGLLAGEHLGGELGLWGMGLGLAAAFAHNRASAVQRNIAGRVGELLASPNQGDLAQGVRATAGSPRLRAALRFVHNQLPVASTNTQPGVLATPQLVGPVTRALLGPPSQQRNQQ